MRILAASVFLAGLTIGIGWNGHGTQSLGLYLLAIAGAWCIISFLILGAWVAALEWYRSRARRKQLRVVGRPGTSPAAAASPLSAVQRCSSSVGSVGHAEPKQSGPRA